MKKRKRAGPPWDSFADWFEAQFGPRPFARRTTGDLWAEMQTAEARLHAARKAVEARERYEAEERAAHYAWEARKSSRR